MDQAIRLAVLPVLLICLSCGRQTEETSQLDAATFEYNKHYSQLGSGIRTFTERRLPKVCVTNDPPDAVSETSNSDLHITNLQMPAGENTQAIAYPMSWSITHVSDQFELMQNLEVSLAAQLRIQGISLGAVELSSKANLARMAKFNQKYEHLLIKVKVDGPVVSVDGKHLRLRDKYTQQEDESLQDYMGRLLMECGDSFLKSYSLGGYFYGLIELSRDDFEKSFSADFQISGKVDAGSKGGDLEKQIKSASKDHRGSFSGRINIVQAGGDDDQDVVSTMKLNQVNVGEILDHVVKFPGIVKAEPAIIDTHYADYTTLLYEAIDLEHSRVHHIDHAPETAAMSEPEKKEHLSRLIKETIFRYESNQLYLGELGDRMSALSRLKVALDIQDGIVEEDVTATEAGFMKSAQAEVLTPRQIYRKAMDTIHQTLKECYVNFVECDIRGLLAKPEVNANVYHILESLEGRQTDDMQLDPEPKAYFHKYMCGEDQKANLTREDLDRKDIRVDLHGHFKDQGIATFRDNGWMPDYYACVWLDTACDLPDGTQGTFVFFPDRTEAQRFACSRIERNQFSKCHVACFDQD